MSKNPVISSHTEDEEMGFLLSGELQITVNNSVHGVELGDTIHWTSETPSQWENPGSGIARLLWIELK
jgi:quercetin dioxygenase-like cupin family protein